MIRLLLVLASGPEVCVGDGWRLHGKAFTSIIIVGLATRIWLPACSAHSRHLVCWDVLTLLAALLAGVSVINICGSFMYAACPDRSASPHSIPDLISLLLLFLSGGCRLAARGAS